MGNLFETLGEILKPQQSTENLKEGQRFYYTGDAANLPSFGKIIEVVPANNYSPLSYKVEYDNPRFEGDKQTSTIFHLSFSKGSGQRFKTIEQYNEEREQQLNRLYSQFPHLKNK